MSQEQIFRLSPHDLDRLAELHNQPGLADPSTLAWSGDRLRARYQGTLARGEMAVWIARLYNPRRAADGDDNPRSAARRAAAPPPYHPSDEIVED